MNALCECWTRCVSFERAVQYDERVVRALNALCRSMSDLCEHWTLRASGERVVRTLNELRKAMNGCSMAARYPSLESAWRSKRSRRLCVIAVRRTTCSVRNMKRPKRGPETKEDKTLRSMSISKDLHVTQPGENREVEDDAQTQAETNEGVHDAARERPADKNRRSHRRRQN
jgi:hypothetical protein